MEDGLNRILGSCKGCGKNIRMCTCHHDIGICVVGPGRIDNSALEIAMASRKVHDLPIVPVKLDMVIGKPMTGESTLIKKLNLEMLNLKSMEPKQVIVMRTDLNMRKGKMIAQGAHASMSVFFQMMEKREEEDLVCYEMYMDRDGWIDRWKSGRFTKIVVGVGSEQEMLDIYGKAKESKLPCSLITDAGLTEFGGVPTNTCIALGPWDPAEIDKLTGHLKLL